MPRRRKVLVGCLVASAVIVALAIVIRWSFSRSMAEHYERALPAELGDVRYLRSNSDLKLWTILIAPVISDACGGAVFRLSPETIAAIESQGAAFFQQALHGRGYRKPGSDYAYYTYEPWQETPVPAGWTGEGMWPGLACAELGSLGDEIYAAANRPGSWCTRKPEAELLVIPSLGLAVLTYLG